MRVFVVFQTKRLFPSLPPEPILKDRPLEQPWSWTRPVPSTSRAGLVFTFLADLTSACSKPSAAPGASKDARGELTPWPSRWSSDWGRKSHRHPWHSPRTGVRDGSQDAFHTHKQRTPPPLTRTHTLAQQRTQPGTTTKSV